ncbi:MAG: helix-turn-helix transcriptional regulator [Clostridia bacterium]|nr:helix-turn-helix transcriptional regulator [Clostridia bacterium]
MTFGTKLQNLRKEKNMSQEDLANLLNVSRQAISKWELDQSLPDTTNIIAISKIFGVTTDYLLLQETVNPTHKSSVPDKTKNVVLLLAGILSSAIGFLGTFTLYFVSRFIKVPMSVKSLVSDGYNTIYVRDFIKFITHFNLELIVLFFLILMLTGISLIIYKYHKVLKAFLTKLFTKIKTFKLKKKSDTTH